eukprot:PLAT14492.1.p1 GENE.PLAT14492.1~~PLAT14492.1.p1  ORF type:complete len:353 (+),score=130.45 PLAT14492.1:78-1136(+)
MSCFVCGVQLEELLRCSRCKSVVYCSPAHQLEDWPHHKKLCKSLAAVAAAKAAEAAEEAASGVGAGGGGEDGGRKEVELVVESPLPPDSVIAAAERSCEELMREATRCLRRFGFAVVDGLLGDAAARAVLAEAKQLRDSGALTASASRIGTGDADGTGKRATRGDVVLWAKPDGEELASSPAVRSMLKRIHELGSALSSHTERVRFGKGHNNLCLKPLESGAMLACYPGGGARYVKHIDNPGGLDGRKVTMLYYLNCDWKPEDGGALRIHRQKRAAVDVAPIGDRLLLFWSQLVVHEVLPSFKPRYALSQWFVAAQPVVKALSKSRFLAAASGLLDDDLADELWSRLRAGEE